MSQRSSDVGLDMSRLFFVAGLLMVFTVGTVSLTASGMVPVSRDLLNCQDLLHGQNLLHEQYLPN